jgi:heme iron utilization protein
MSQQRDEDLAALSALIRSRRNAALAVLEPDGAPLTAMVSYVETADLSALLLHLSGLSAHKRALLADPRCSLLICQEDHAGVPEVMQLARVAIQAEARLVEKSGPDYDPLRLRFLEKLPGAEVMFGLGDFDLLRITPRSARYVAGFGRAMTVSPWPFGAQPD